MNPNTDAVLMPIIGELLLPGTRIATLGNPVIIENEYRLSLSRFPAVHIETGKQQYQQNSTETFDGTIQFIITYYDRWDQATTGIDVVRQNIKADLEIMQSNLMANSSLSLAGDPHATSIAKYQPAPYKGELDNTTVQGVTLLKRALTITVNVLPFDA